MYLSPSRPDTTVTSSNRCLAPSSRRCFLSARLERGLNYSGVARAQGLFDTEFRLWSLLSWKFVIYSIIIARTCLVRTWRAIRDDDNVRVTKIRDNFTRLGISEANQRPHNRVSWVVRSKHLLFGSRSSTMCLPVLPVLVALFSVGSEAYS